MITCCQQGIVKCIYWLQWESVIMALIWYEKQFFVIYWMQDNLGHLISITEIIALRRLKNILIWYKLNRMNPKMKTLQFFHGFLIELRGKLWGKTCFTTFFFIIFLKKLLLLVSSKLKKYWKISFHCTEHCRRVCQAILLIENVIIWVLLATGSHTLCWILKLSIFKVQIICKLPKVGDSS